MTYRSKFFKKSLKVFYRRFFYPCVYYRRSEKFNKMHQVFLLQNTAVITRCCYIYIPFLPLIEPTIRCFKFLNPECFRNFEGFFFKYHPIIWNFLTSFSNKPVGNCFISQSQLPQRVRFCEEDIPVFSKEVVNLCLFFTHIERVFFGTPYFAATSLFVIPFSKSFKALHFTPTGLLFNHFCLAKNQECFFFFNSRRFVHVFKNRMHDLIRKRWNVRILVKKFKFY